MIARPGRVRRKLVPRRNVAPRARRPQKPNSSPNSASAAIWTRSCGRTPRPIGEYPPLKRPPVARRASHQLCGRPFSSLWNVTVMRTGLTKHQHVIAPRLSAPICRVGSGGR